MVAAPPSLISRCHGAGRGVVSKEGQMFHPRALRRLFVAAAVCVAGLASLCVQAQAHGSKPPVKSSSKSSLAPKTSASFFGVGRKAH